MNTGEGKTMNEDYIWKRNGLFSFLFFLFFVLNIFPNPKDFFLRQNGEDNCLISTYKYSSYQFLCHTL